MESQGGPAVGVLSGQPGSRKDLFIKICSRRLSQISAVLTTAAPLRCGIVCVCASGSLRRAPVRISYPLDMNISVSMPPIDKHIDPVFDCLDNLCEFQHNSSHSGFKAVRGGAVLYLSACFS